MAFALGGIWQSEPFLLRLRTTASLRAPQRIWDERRLFWDEKAGRNFGLRRPDTGKVSEIGSPIRFMRGIRGQKRFSLDVPL
jgi:hypothetical protein